MAVSSRQISLSKISALVEQRHVEGFRAGIGQRVAKIQLCRVPDHLAIYRQSPDGFLAHAGADVHLVGIDRFKKALHQFSRGGKVLG